MHRKTFRPQELMKADCRIVADQFKFAAEHASCAVYLISELVLSRLAFWHRLRGRIWHNKDEKKCDELLRKGTA
jgi:hypothetical protein